MDKGNESEENEMSLKDSMAKYKAQWSHRDEGRLKVVNRRRVRLFEMIRSGNEYFSEESIRKRDPLLYEMYVGWRDIQPGKRFHNTPKDMSSFLLRQIDKESFEEDLEKALRNDMNAYGEQKVIDELDKVRDVNSTTDSKREDDTDELIRLMFIQFLYSKEEFNCDGDSDYDNDKSKDRFDEENYFNSDCDESQ